MVHGTLFFDLGGVVLTNGWDRHARSRAVERFSLNAEEFAERHDSMAPALETGHVSLDEYLSGTVFYRDQPFSREDFVAFIQAQSQAYSGVLSLLEELAARPDLLLASLNNESRELSEYRIRRFELTRYFRLFLTSSYLGVMKPNEQIYRLALELTQQPPERCLFIDDRELNVEGAQRAGLPAVRYTGVGELRHELASRGFLA